MPKLLIEGKNGLLILFSVLCLSLSACGEAATVPKESDIEESSTVNIESESVTEMNQEESEKSSLATSTDLQMSPYLVRAQSNANELYGYVDIRTGEYVIAPSFSKADEEFGDDGWALADGNIINTDGSPLFEPQSISDVREYESDCIVAVDTEKKTALLYHGADFVCNLEIPVEGYTEVSAWSAFKGGSRNGSFYIPERYFVLRVVDSTDQVRFVWYTADGDVILETEHIGGMAGDETGYYFIWDDCVDVIDLDGNILESKEKLSIGVPVVEFDGDKWYVPLNMTTSNRMYNTDLYTNGFEILCQISTGDFPVSASDGIIRTPDNRYMKSDGTIFYTVSSLENTVYNFQNGYAKVMAGAQGKYSGEFYGYIDTEGTEIMPIPKDRVDEYSSVLKDGYIVYGENGLWGIMNISGDIILEPKYTSLYSMGVGK